MRFFLLNSVVLRVVLSVGARENLSAQHTVSIQVNEIFVNSFSLKCRANPLMLNTIYAFSREDGFLQ